MVHYISPYSLSKNIGGAINSAITQLNPKDDDWIVHIDQDVCFLRPDSKAQIETILSVTKYDVLGCLTNRLASPHQLHNGQFNDDGDIRKHVAIANECHAKDYGNVTGTTKNIAAMLMCFRYKTWKTVGGFAENSIRFDSEFTDTVKRRCGKLGIMTGVYCFHLYRMWSDDPVYEIGHLVNTTLTSGK